MTSMTRKASIKETGEELSQEAWTRFEEAADQVQEDAPANRLREQDDALGKTTAKTEERDRDREAIPNQRPPL